MKSIIVNAVLLLSTATSVYGQKINASNVPASVKSSFQKNYPAAIAKWEKEDGKYEANFKYKGIAMSALFEPSGTMTETEVDIKIADLPVAVLAYVKEHYKGKNIKEAAKITKADGTINYEAEVGGMDVLFNAEGKFLKEAKD